MEKVFIAPTTIYLMCGYRRTGKDTLYNILSLGDSNNSFPWKIYGKEKGGNTFIIDRSRIIRFGFADALKEEVFNIYGIPKNIPDLEKDVKRYRHYLTGEIISARDAYIEYGANKRKEDIDYWCKKITNIPKGICSCIVTDWRFINEVEYVSSNFHTITIRLYRSEVEIPPKDVVSEHSLDNYLTDYLFVRDEEELKKATEVFPQYASYVYLCDV